MEISIQDIGVVHEADIKLEGLTVIAGENGVGKSAVGKALYGLFKWKDSLIDSIRPALRENITSLMMELGIMYNELKKDTQSLQSYIGSQRQLTYNNIKDYISQNRELNVPQAIQLIDQYMDESKELINPESIAESCQSIMNKLFLNNLTNKLNAKEIGSVKMKWEKNSTIIEFDHENIRVSEKPVHPKEDVILIDSLSAVSLFQYLKENLAFQNAQSILLPDFTKDLVQKISESGYSPDYSQPLVKKLQAIINGQVILEEDRLFYKDENNIQHPIQNVASGIKSLGLLQLLIAGNKINKDSLLIIDEPEVHLHPSWQLAYAKIIVELVKEDINVLITSHSSTFIEALKVYSENEGVGQKTNFYLGKMTEKGSVFEEVTESLEPIYKAFAAPSLELMLEKSRGKYQQQTPVSLAQDKQAPYSKKDNQDS